MPAVRPLPSVVKGVQACRLPALKRLKPLKPSAAASTRHSGHCPLLLRAFKPAVCQPSGHSPLLLRAFKPAVCQPSNPLKCLQRSAAASTMTRHSCKLLPSVVTGAKPAVCQPSGHCPLMGKAFNMPFANPQTKPFSWTTPSCRENLQARPASQRCSLCFRTCSGVLFRCLFFVRNVPMFLAGVSCVTAIRPPDCDDQTTVEQTGQLCARHRVSLLTAPSLT